MVQSGTNRYTAEQVVHFGTPKTPFTARRGRSKKSGTPWNTRNTLVQVFILVTRLCQYFCSTHAMPRGDGKVAVTSLYHCLKRAD
ncbi:hypothetical protein KHS38_15505 [Mucilaginibacter sp. Bleaf8]|uniref:hypothetical protein n=1 Tax=Mucilaginibacter sp. Bleaf8 TaxID=2834430 RepID=UPI001BD01528|nr:hypothetical protein [Mucilaginibacter sp. Bleaf8]MBS7565813.1 hypothetical protein [Mucilaginibacter sp. Bleaf8]